MTEKKAQELFSRYLQAERIGNDTEAIQLEHDLNNAGWFVVSGSDGLTIARKGSQTDLPEIEDYLIPKDSKVTAAPETDNPNRNLWIGLAIGGVVIAIIITVIIIIKLRRNAAQPAGFPARG